MPIGAMVPRGAARGRGVLPAGRAAGRPGPRSWSWSVAVHRRRVVTSQAQNRCIHLVRGPAQHKLGGRRRGTGILFARALPNQLSDTATRRYARYVYTDCSLVRELYFSQAKYRSIDWLGGASKTWLAGEMWQQYRGTERPPLVLAAAVNAGPVVSSTPPTAGVLKITAAEISASRPGPKMTRRAISWRGQQHFTNHQHRPPAKPIRLGRERR